MMTNIERLHKVDMDIVREVARICDEHGFKYYMLGGTMLGAIRLHPLGRRYRPGHAPG